MSPLHAAHYAFSNSTFEILRFLATVNFTLADSSSKCFMQNKNQLCEKLNSVFLLHKISLGANANRKLLCSQGKVRGTEVPASSRLHATAFSGILLAIKMLFFFFL